MNINLLIKIPPRLNKSLRRHPISSKIALEIRLRDTEDSQRETLRLIENLSSKVDNFSDVTSEQCCSTSRVEPNGGSSDMMNMDFDGLSITTRVASCNNI